MASVALDAHSPRPHRPREVSTCLVWATAWTLETTMRRLGVIILLVLAACTTNPENSVTNTQDARSAGYLALGDSYTIGESVEVHERWPVGLARALENSGFELIEVQIVARSGWTTSELDEGIDDAEPQGPFDLVSLLIGVNNQFRGLDIEDYRADVIELLDRAIGFAGGDPSRVVVVSIPDWGATPFGGSHDSQKVAAEIDAFNAVGEREAGRAGVHWVDITAISRRDAPGLVAEDGLHPSGAQYEAWVELILPVALAALRG